MFQSFSRFHFLLIFSGFIAEGFEFQILQPRSARGIGPCEVGRAVRNGFQDAECRTVFSKIGGFIGGFGPWRMLPMGLVFWSQGLDFLSQGLGNLSQGLLLQIQDSYNPELVENRPEPLLAPPQGPVGTEDTLNLAEGFKNQILQPIFL